MKDENSNNNIKNLYVDAYQDKYEYKMDVQGLLDMLDKKKKNPDAVNYLSFSCLDFVISCLHEDPEKRLTANDALNHAWFVNYNKHTQIKRNQNQT